MSGGRPLARTARAIAGVIALYGLLLQVFLTAASPILAPELRDVICASHEAGGKQAPDRPGAHDHRCCTPAQAGAPLLPAPLGSSLVAYPAGSIEIGFRPEARVPRTGPPTRAHSARGPPLV